MRLKDHVLRVMLVVIAGLLAANLAVSLITPSARAASGAQEGGFRAFAPSGAGVALACSADGKVVYAADLKNVYRSLDFGKPGSWEPVLE